MAAFFILCFCAFSWLKDQLYRELNISWPAAAEKRIADADVWCDRDP